MTEYSIHDKTFNRLLLAATTAWVDGPWRFVSHGAIGAYPGFVDDKGRFVPLGAIAMADPTKPSWLNEV